MKTSKSIFFSFLVALAVLASCTQEKVDPALVLDEVLIPEGYIQSENPPADALARLEELRQQNTNEHYYYIQKVDNNSDRWIFPQKELKIEYVANSESASPNVKPAVTGVVVKKIRGDYRNEEFIVVENQPAPKDGLKAFYEYIQENLVYPADAKENGVTGRVFVEFIVDTNGKLTNVKAVKGIGAGCDEEAVRVIKEAPAWKPAMIVDIPVKTRMILPISYKLG